MTIDKSVLEDIKVLYVEDEPDISEGISEMLSRVIPNLIVASNGIEGLKKYKEHNPEIIITDIRMPGMNGLDMCREIKKINKNVQIIVTSAHSDVNFFIESIEIGVNQYVLKPIAKKDLFEAIYKCYQVYHLEKKVNDQVNTIFKLFRAIEHSHSMILIADKKLKVEYVNPSFSEITGFAVSEVVGGDPKIDYLKNYSIISDEKICKHITSGKDWKGEFLNKKKNGEKYWEYGSFTPIKSDNNEIVSYVQVTEDISEIKKVTEALRISEDKHRSLIESLGEGIGIIDLSFEITFSNPAFNEIMETDKLTGNNFKDFVDKGQLDEFEEISKNLQVEDKHQFDLRVITAKNNCKILTITITPQLDEKREKVIGSFCIFKDITEIRHLIEELKSARKAAEDAYQTIEKQNKELNEANEKLKESEVKLSEMNEILMEYIKATGK
ncbi:MAG: PAS domain S-box protein [Bacteroidales bacterium]